MIFIVQFVESGLCDVDTAARQVITKYSPCLPPSVSPRHASLLHDVGRRHVVAPHVVLPLLETDHAAQHVASVNTDPHVHLDPGGRSDGADGGDHGESHPHNVHRVVWSGDWKAGHTVVTVAQDLDPQTLVVTGQLVKLTAQPPGSSQH